MFLIYKVHKKVAEIVRSPDCFLRLDNFVNELHAIVFDLLFVRFENFWFIFERLIYSHFQPFSVFFFICIESVNSTIAFLFPQHRQALFRFFLENGK